MIKDIQERILKLKRERGACILAHCYQTHDILEIADFVGDSFGLAQKAQTADAQTVVMCGVRFMAETVKILCPEKRVLLPSPTRAARWRSFSTKSFLGAEGEVPRLRGRGVHKHHRRAENALRRLCYVKLRAQDYQAPECG